jgi:hypothetical protein
VNRNIAISLFLAAGLGAAIWAASLVVTGSAEPWDAESQYYFVSLFVAGAIVGFLCPRNLWSAFLGVVAGQLVYLLVFLPSSPLLPLGIVFLLGYGLLSLLGAVLASKLRHRLESIKSSDGA